MAKGTVEIVLILLIVVVVRLLLVILQKSTVVVTSLMDLMLIVRLMVHVTLTLQLHHVKTQQLQLIIVVSWMYVQVVSSVFKVSDVSQKILNVLMNVKMVIFPHGMLVLTKLRPVPDDVKIINVK